MIVLSPCVLVSWRSSWGLPCCLVLLFLACFGGPTIAFGRLQGKVLATASERWTDSAIQKDRKTASSDFDRSVDEERPPLDDEVRGLLIPSTTATPQRFFDRSDFTSTNKALLSAPPAPPSAYRSTELSSVLIAVDDVGDGFGNLIRGGTGATGLFTNYVLTEDIKRALASPGSGGGPRRASDFSGFPMKSLTCRTSLSAFGDFSKKTGIQYVIPTGVDDSIALASMLAESRRSVSGPLAGVFALVAEDPGLYRVLDHKWLCDQLLRGGSMMSTAEKVPLKHRGEAAMATSFPRLPGLSSSIDHSSDSLGVVPRSPSWAGSWGEDGGGEQEGEILLPETLPIREDTLEDCYRLIAEAVRQGVPAFVKVAFGTWGGEGVTKVGSVREFEAAVRKMGEEKKAAEQEKCKQGFLAACGGGEGGIVRGCCSSPRGGKENVSEKLGEFVVSSTSGNSRSSSAPGEENIYPLLEEDVAIVSEHPLSRGHPSTPRQDRLPLQSADTPPDQQHLILQKGVPGEVIECHAIYWRGELVSAHMTRTNEEVVKHISAHSFDLSLGAWSPAAMFQAKQLPTNFALNDENARDHLVTALQRIGRASRRSWEGSSAEGSPKNAGSTNTGYTGMMNVEFIIPKDQKTDTFVIDPVLGPTLLEINPRFGGFIHGAIGSGLLEDYMNLLVAAGAGAAAERVGPSALPPREEWPLIRSDNHVPPSDMLSHNPLGFHVRNLARLFSVRSL